MHSSVLCKKCGLICACKKSNSDAAFLLFFSLHLGNKLADALEQPVKPLTQLQNYQYTALRPSPVPGLPVSRLFSMRVAMAASGREMVRAVRKLIQSANKMAVSKMAATLSSTLR